MRISTKRPRVNLARWRARGAGSRGSAPARFCAEGGGRESLLRSCRRAAIVGDDGDISDREYFSRPITFLNTATRSWDRRLSGRSALRPSLNKCGARSVGCIRGISSSVAARQRGFQALVAVALANRGRLVELFRKVS